VPMRRSAARPYRTVQSGRRRYIWGRYFVDTVAAGGAIANTNLLGDLETELGSALVGCTIMRIRGTLTHLPSAAITELALGIGVFPVSSGVTEPVGQEYADWMYWERFKWFATAATSSEAQRIPIDVRSRRRLDEVEQTLILAETNGAAANTWNLSLSILVLLP